MPVIIPLVGLKLNPGGKPFAVKPSGVFAPVTVKLNGWPRNATALNALVTTAGAFELGAEIICRIQAGVGNHLFRLARTIPIQMRLREPPVGDIQLEVVTHAGLQGVGAGPVGRALRLPLVNQQLVIDPQPAAVVAVHIKNISLRILRLHLAGPAHGVKPVA